MSQSCTWCAGVFLQPFHRDDEDPVLLHEARLPPDAVARRTQLLRAWIGEHHSNDYEIYGQPELFIATAGRARMLIYS